MDTKPTSQWTPTALELMQAMIAITTIPQQKTPAIFIHGSPVRSDELDERLCNAVLETRTFDTKIVLNGLTAKMCKEKNLAYGGHEKWGEMMYDKVDPSDIIILPASSHTGAESKNLLSLAKENGWKSITIASYPHHILRCFLQIIALMPKDEIVKVNPLTFHDLSWNEQMIKPVMGGKTVLGGENVNGTLNEHIQEEFNRIVLYGQEPEIGENGPKFMRNATIPEMLDYLQLVS